MNIAFDEKFTENNIDLYLESYFSNSFITNENKISFDLTITEWVSTEEVCFLFSWIRKLISSGKKVKVILPFQFEIKTYKDISLEIKEKIDSIDFIDNTKKAERRKRLNLFLLGIWGMFDRVGLTDLDFENIIEGYNRKVEIVRKSNFSHQVIPFTVLDSQLSKERKTYVDTEFNDVLNGKRTQNKAKNFKDHYPLFELKTDIIDLLTSNNCFSPFESKIISHIITKELFMNSLEHSGEKECYLTVSLNNKWGTSSGENFIQHFKDEKDVETLDFFKDKSKILSKQKNTLSNFQKVLAKENNIFRETNLYNYNEDFKDFSYVQFTFIDFGQGIYNTLKENFADYNSIKNSTDLFINKNIHSQILEYAFKVESSRNPYERDIEYAELIPRGLYFLIDMVRRFKGLLVARSGEGKVIYDFSDKIFLKKEGEEVSLTHSRMYEAKEAIRPLSQEPSFFRGTMLTIILPEREMKDLKRTPVRFDNKVLNKYIFNLDNDEQYPKKVFAPTQYTYLSMVFIYHEAIKTLSTKELHDKNKVNSYIFRKIDQQLDKLQNTSNLLFLDFEFLYERTNYIKIISWLTNSPKVNEFSKVIILNLTKEESSVIEIFKENYSFKDSNEDVDFLFKPIPCIDATHPIRKELSLSNIKWVGINDSDDENLLNNLLLGVKDSYPESYFNKPWITEGHIFGKFQGETYSVFTDINQLLSEYQNSRTNFLKEWIVKNEIIDGEQPKNGQKKHLFLTSRGSYQRRYISLYESLHNKYVARLYAKMLIDRYIDSNLSPNKSLDEIKFDKIIVVTVSSQLIGLAIRDLISNNQSYEKFCFLNKNGKIKPPKLIRLASYFSFDTEKPFEDIEPNDRVIIVNDVVSTGALIERLVNGIMDRGADVKSILTVVDNRFSPQKLDTNIEYNSVKFNDETEGKIISLCSSLKDSRLKIKKFKHKPLGEYEIKRINPILNTVVELSYRHSEKNRVLFEEFEEFVGREFSTDEIYKVGHFVQNLTHNGYYTDMNEMFEYQNGENILTEMKHLIESNIQYLSLSKNECNKVFINNSIDNILKVEDIKEDSIAKLGDIKKLLSELKSEIESNSKCNHSKEFAPDFIFHPVFSGIEEVSDLTFNKVFGTDVDNIVGLQRYDTSVGWRFPFPAKRYNKITKGKHVLIIDSGSLTGDSLIQLVDSISFLEVGRIDFLSIIGRIGDFQREFYSRLKSIKVKSLRIEDEGKRNIDTTVSLNLLFGTNIHIPPYGSRTSCPFCKEIDTLKVYKNRLNGKLSTATNYIIRRLNDEIRLFEKSDDFVQPPHFPVTDSGKCDFKSLFIMRDRIGKVASYRFYNEYFLFFDKLANDIGDEYFRDKSNLMEFELILMCILHEPSLVSIIKDLLITNYEIAFSILDKIIKEEYSLDEFNFNWSKYSLLRLYHSFLGDRIYKVDIIEAICKFSINDKHCQEYISFFLIEPFLQNQSTGLKKKALGIVNVMSSGFDSKVIENSEIYNSDDIRRLFKDLLLTFEPVETEDVNQAFFNLKLFFDVINNQHTKLFRANISLLNTIIKNENINELPEIKQLSGSITKTIRECIYNNLKTIKHSELSIMNDWPLHKSFIGNSCSLIECIEELEKKFEKLIKLKQEDDVEKVKSTIIEFQKVLVEEIQTKYLLMDTDFYTYCSNYYVDLNRCVQNAIDDGDLQTYIKARSNFKIEEFNFDEIIVQGHYVYFYFAFQEIFVNAAKREENDNTKISFIVDKIDQSNEVILKIKQDSCYIQNTNKKYGGLSKIVIPVFNAFCGEENINIFKESSDEFIIEIRFNTKELKTSKDEE